ncbi:MAG TPA: nitroreductase family protein [Acidimicrobiales bacterium]|nr:nitroreductase family protein [Acidimicrobiales bacterium]
MAPLLNLDPDQLLTTTRSVRKRLDLERPVEREVIEECLEVAIQAPTGSNMQGWHWVFVTDAAKKQALADMYNESFRPYVAAGASMANPYKEGDTRGERADKVRDSATYLADHLHEVPVMMIPCHWGRVDGADNTTQAGYWGSLLPAVWSFMLALRARGLGSAWTTLHLPKEKQAADLLGIPYERVAQGGLFPIAYTQGTDFKKAKRQPLETITHWDTW